MKFLGSVRELLVDESFESHKRIRKLFHLIGKDFVVVWIHRILIRNVEKSSHFGWMTDSAMRLKKSAGEWQASGSGYLRMRLQVT